MIRSSLLDLPSGSFLKKYIPLYLCNVSAYIFQDIEIKPTSVISVYTHSESHTLVGDLSDVTSHTATVTGDPGSQQIIRVKSTWGTVNEIKVSVIK